MKIQCSCGAKYSFDVTHEMANERVHFVCSTCGLDASEYVTNLIRQEIGSSGTPSSTSRPAIRVSTSTSPVLTPSSAGLRLQGSHASPSAAAEPVAVLAGAGMSGSSLC